MTYNNKTDLNLLNLPLTISATAIALPDNVVTSAMLDSHLNKPSGYVNRRSGIKQRYHSINVTDIANKIKTKNDANHVNNVKSASNVINNLTDIDAQQTNSHSQSKLASQAVLKVMARQNLTEQEVDLLIAVNAVPEQAIPCTASLILKQLGWHNRIAGFDVNASCVGILPALMTASSLQASGVYGRIIVVACDLASHGLNWQDEESSFIFGDGACALVVDPLTEQDKQHDDTHAGCILAYDMQSFTQYADKCQIKAGGTARNITTGCVETDFYFKMDGKPLFKMVAEKFLPFVESVLAKAGLRKDDIDLWIPHQASHLGLKHMILRMGLDPKKVINIYAEYGNQVSASMPTALHIARESGQLKQGQTVMLLGTGAGVSFAALVWRV